MNKLVVLPPPVVPAPADQTIVVDELIIEGYRDVPLHLVRISYTNRTRFSPEALQQLADNIAEVGILQPILMRPVTPTAEAPQILEIVAGERRFRAAVMAGLIFAPASIKILSDRQAAEIQLLENIQRENPHPLEEAIGFEQLMLKHGYNADQLAAKVKQSRSYVYARLKLCALSLRAREMFLDDIQRFTASTALLIARIPTPDLQDKALGEIMAPQHNGETMTVRQAAQHIAGRYTLNLADAPFDIKDAKMLASAGNCVKCPKRTGNQPEIYSDAKSADVCTDPDCFSEKKAAHHQRLIVIANKTKLPILEGADANQIRSNAWSRSGEFVLPGTNLFSFERVVKSTGMSGTVASLLGSAHLPAPVKYIKEGSGAVTPVFRRSEVQDALERQGACETVQAHDDRLAAEEKIPEVAAARKQQQERDEQQARQRAERKRRAATMTAERVALYRKVREKAQSGLSLTMLRELAKLMVRDDMNEMSLPDDLVGDLYSFDRDDDAACTFIDQADATTVQLLMMDLIVGEGLSVATHYIEDEESEPDPRYIAIKVVADADGIKISEADLAAAAAALAVREIDVNDLDTAEDVREVIEENVEHLGVVCSYIVSNAPHHIGNVKQAANLLGYEYGPGGWHKKSSQAEETAPTTDEAAASAQADQAEQSLAPTRTKLGLKKKSDAPQSTAVGPVIRVKKDRAAQAAAALTPAVAWPFPTAKRA